jgi:hypothetical protein
MRNMRNMLRHVVYPCCSLPQLIIQLFVPASLQLSACIQSWRPPNVLLLLISGWWLYHNSPSLSLTVDSHPLGTSETCRNYKMAIQHDCSHQHNPSQRSQLYDMRVSPPELIRRLACLVCMVDPRVLTNPSVTRDQPAQPHFHISIADQLYYVSDANGK